MAHTAALMDPTVDMDKLSYEIFSILESKFLFGYDDPPKLAATPPATPTPPAKPPAGKVRILSIDAGAGLLPAVALARLESSLRNISGDPSARIADFFDLAAGSGAGGVLAALLFTRGSDGRPLFSADGALQFLIKNRRRILAEPKMGIFRGIFGRSGGGAGGIFGRVFADVTLRDTVKPVLIPCYDVATGAPFMFSRADAVEADGYDFLIRDVCAATCGGRAAHVRSVDGRTRVSAVGGGVAMANPAAAAITHVLNNKQEFPHAFAVEDLLVVSLGGGEAGRVGRSGQSPPSAAELVRIAGEGTADMVDQAVAMAFGHSRTTNYVRVQANGLVPAGKDTAAMLERNVESVLFCGKKISEQTNGEKLEGFAGKLVKEQERRMRSNVPTVVIKPSMTPARTSSATTATTSTRTSTTATTSSSSSL